MRKGEVIEHRVWLNSETGRVASIYGAHPNPHDYAWSVVTRGWTIRWDDGTTGCGRVPFATREEAQNFLDRWLVFSSI